MWKNPYMGVPIFFEFQKNTLRHPRVPLVCKHYGFPLWEKHGFHSGNTLSFHFGSIVGFHFGSSCGLPFWSTMGFHFGSIMGFHFVNARTSILGPRFHFGSHTRYHNMVMWISKLYSHVYPFLKRINSLLHVPCEPTGQSQSSLGCNGFSV